MTHLHGDLGCWIGQDYWKKRYATEASRAVIDFGFSVLGLHRIQARHMTRNPASGRVLKKIGIRHEGRLRDYTLKWGVFEDAEIYRILKDDQTR